MKVSINFALLLATLLFGLLLVPRSVLASTADCSVEPESGPIADGEVFAGTNCTLHTEGDIDSFTFTGTSGDTYQLATAIKGAVASNICLTLYNPDGVQIFPVGAPSPGNGCTEDIGYGGASSSVVTDQKLTATGTYTIDITEVPSSSGAQNYAVSLERLYPFPPNAQAVPKLGEAVTGDIAPLTDTNAFTFGPVATAGEYEVTATLTGSITANICLTIYNANGVQIFPAGAPSPGNGCTEDIGYGGVSSSVMYDFTPSEDGTYMAFLQVYGNDGTATYNLEVSCVVGTCPPFPPITYPPCTLTDTASYDATTSTLTMNFTVGNTKYSDATWSAWLTYQNSIESLFSVSEPIQPIANRPVAITKTKSDLPKEGEVGVLSTLTTATQGIVCSSYVQTNTGTP
jgi:hypothetical protein